MPPPPLCFQVSSLAVAPLSGRHNTGAGDVAQGYSYTADEDEEEEAGSGSASGSDSDLEQEEGGEGAAGPGQAAVTAATAAGGVCDGLGPRAQILITACWTTVKEVSLLAGALARHVPLPGGEGQGL